MMRETPTVPRPPAKLDKTRRSIEVCVVLNDHLKTLAISQAVRRVHPGAQIVRCHTAAETIAALRISPVRLAIVGLTLPDLDGLDVLLEITRERLANKLLAVADRWDERVKQVIPQARLDGVYDCVAEPPAALQTALRALAEGGSYFGPAVKQTLYTGKTEVVGRIFSPTQQRVFATIGDGCDDQVAAALLGVSASTIHSHRQRIMQKLRIHSRTDLMREAIRRGFVRFTAEKTLRPGFEYELARPARAPASDQNYGGAVVGFP
jgi:two-component system, NarL family, nitrate/nitrite response regulator NarL